MEKLVLLFVGTLQERLKEFDGEKENLSDNLQSAALKISDQQEDLNSLQIQLENLQFSITTVSSFASFLCDQLFSFCDSFLLYRFLEYHFRWTFALELMTIFQQKVFFTSSTFNLLHMIIDVFFVFLVSTVRNGLNLHCPNCGIVRDEVSTGIDGVSLLNDFLLFLCSAYFMNEINILNQRYIHMCCLLFDSYLGARRSAFSKFH